jgi:hypothetical protein
MPWCDFRDSGYLLLNGLRLTATSRSGEPRCWGLLDAAASRRHEANPGFQVLPLFVEPLMLFRNLCCGSHGKFVVGNCN